MQKFTSLLFTIAFCVGCCGLWLLVSIAECLYPPMMQLRSYPVYTQWLIAYKPALLIFPVPAFLFCWFSKSQTRTEGNLIYIAALSIVFSILATLVISAAILPWIATSHSGGR